jgi:hypothetical protein
MVLLTTTTTRPSSTWPARGATGKWSVPDRRRRHAGRRHLRPAPERRKRRLRGSPKPSRAPEGPGAGCLLARGSHASYIPPPAPIRRRRSSPTTTTTRARGCVPSSTRSRTTTAPGWPGRAAGAAPRPLFGPIGSNSRRGRAGTAPGTTRWASMRTPGRRRTCRLSPALTYRSRQRRRSRPVARAGRRRRLLQLPPTRPEGAEADGAAGQPRR